MRLLKTPFADSLRILFSLLFGWQALKVESGYICLIVVIFLVSIIPFCYTIAWCFSRNVKLKAANGVSDIVPARPGEVFFQDEGKERLDKYHCRKRILVFVLQCFIVVSM
jgi:phosphotransferase system  glucose/maltose/N-acetylglucosamine-specific IIC component